jgi:site-specific DNA-methyltransferase (adenine-specific)
MIITLLRKPLEGSVADNALKHGCGALNIDATRITTSDNLNGGAYASSHQERHDGKKNWRYERGKAGDYEQPTGRWPANFILTHKEGCTSQGEDWACVEGCPVKELDQQSGYLKSTTRSPTGNPIYPTSNTSVTWNANNVMDTSQRGFNDDGGASRFFKQFQKDQVDEP